MLEQREVDEAVNSLPYSQPLRALLYRFGFGSYRPHEGTSDAAVEEQAAQDHEAPSPAELVKEPGVYWSHGGEEDGAAGHGDSVGNRSFLVEVLPDHSQGRVEVEGQSQT